MAWWVLSTPASSVEATLAISRDQDWETPSKYSPHSVKPRRRFMKVQAGTRSENKLIDRIWQSYF